MAESNQSVARALQIMDALARAREPLGIREIARAIGVSPSIAQRLVATLAEYGFAQQDAARKYGVGLRAFALGSAYLSGNALTREALAELQVLSERHRLNTYLGVLRGSTMVYLLACQSSGPIAINIQPGAEASLHSTAMGKALLAGMDEGEAQRLLGKEPFSRLTAGTRTRWPALRDDLARARRVGYTLSEEENLVGVVAVGAAVRDASGGVVAAVSGALARHEAPPSKVPALGRLVREAADRISTRLGAPLATRAA